MSLYDLFRALIRACARNGSIPADQAFKGIELINNLERLNAFGTLASTERGKDPR